MAADALAYIDGEAYAPGRWYDTVDPTTEKTIAAVADCDAADVDAAARAAAAAAPSWAALPAERRGEAHHERGREGERAWLHGKSSTIPSTCVVGLKGWHMRHAERTGGEAVCTSPVRVRTGGKPWHAVQVGATMSPLTSVQIGGTPALAPQWHHTVQP